MANAQTITTNIEGVQFADGSTEFLFQVEKAPKGNFEIWVTHNKLNHWFSASVIENGRAAKRVAGNWLNQGDFTFYQGSFVRFNSIYNRGEILGVDGKTHYTDRFEDPDKAIAEAKAIASRLTQKVCA